MKRTLRKLTLVIAILALALPAAFATRGRSRSRVMVDRLVEEARTGRRYNAQSIERSQRSYEAQVLRQMRSRSQMTTRELTIDNLREYVSKYKESPQNLETLSELLGSITARGNAVPAEQLSTANLLAQSVKLTERGKLSLEPRDMLEVHRNWTAREKDMLSDVILEARRIVEQNPSKTPEQAFETALANRGLLEKFNKRCR